MDTTKYIKLCDLSFKNLKKLKTNHHKKKGWINFFYVNNKKKEINYKKIHNKKIDIKTVHQFKKGIFYKLHQYSINNSYFDYYKVLKPELIEKNYLIQHMKMSCKGYSVKYKDKIIPKYLREIQSTENKTGNKNPFIVNFN